jgi:hypothetical protein
MCGREGVAVTGRGGRGGMEREGEGGTAVRRVGGGEDELMSRWVVPAERLGGEGEEE